MNVWQNVRSQVNAFTSTSHQLFIRIQREDTKSTRAMITVFKSKKEAALRSQIGSINLAEPCSWAILKIYDEASNAHQFRTSWNRLYFIPVIENAHGKCNETSFLTEWPDSVQRYPAAEVSDVCVYKFPLYILTSKLSLIVMSKINFLM